MTETTEPKTDRKLMDRFNTPVFDSLPVMHRAFVLAYCQCFDAATAHDTAGYKNKIPEKRKEMIYKLTHNPKILKAMDEYMGKQIEQIDSSKAALCVRLLNQSLASPFDVYNWVKVYENGKGDIVNKPSLMPKDFADVEPRFHCALVFIQRGRDGSYGWDTMGQHRATTMLSKLMMWDQEEKDNDTPIVFNFGEIQNGTYIKPADTVIELGSVQDTSDEIDKLTQH